jgi:ribosomal protein S1
MSNNFESELLKRNYVNPTGICTGKIIAIKRIANGKNFAVVDIGAKKNYIVDASEFTNIPELKTEVQVLILNDGGNQQYGLASHKKAIMQIEQNEQKAKLQSLLDNHTLINCQVVAKLNDVGYEVKSDAITSKLKCIYKTNRECKIGSNITACVKYINPYSIVLTPYNEHMQGETKKFHLKQVVKCLLHKAASIMYLVQIVDDQGKVIFPNEDNAIDCVLPFAEMGCKNTYEATKKYQIGDIVDAVIISLSPNRIVLSKSAIDDKEMHDKLKDIAVGRIIKAKINEKTDRMYMLTATVDNKDLQCEMRIDEIAWSLAQRAEQESQNTLAVGNTVLVQVVGIDARSNHVQVSYKTCNLSNPLTTFKNEINSATNENWKVGDTLPVKSTFPVPTHQDYRQFCYVNYKGVDMCMENWRNEAIISAMNKNQSFEVTITAIEEETNGNYKIKVAHVNDDQLKINNVMKLFALRGTYNCIVTRMMRGDYIVQPLEHLHANGTTTEIKLPSDTTVTFMIRGRDTQSRLVEGQKCICKLMYIDYKARCLYFSVDAYTEDQNRKTVNKNTISHNFSIGNM